MLGIGLWSRDVEVEWAKGPPGSGFGAVGGGGRDRRSTASRVGGTEGDPAFEDADFSSRQFSVGRHFEAIVLEGVDEQALFGFARHEHRT